MPCGRYYFTIVLVTSDLAATMQLMVRPVDRGEDIMVHTHPNLDLTPWYQTEAFSRSTRSLVPKSQHTVNMAELVEEANDSRPVLFLCVDVIQSQ